ncbi:MAG: GNAT family N-acetyltransferase [Eubacteriales bacterium]|nr:GNAT family N-acetyltransferase [Eubacteriales bacterium]
MDDCFLKRPEAGDEDAVKEMLQTWRAYGGRMNPGLLRRFDGDYPRWLKLLDNQHRGIDTGEDPAQTLFLLKREDGAVLGAVSLRHALTRSNWLDGGHVGYGIRPEFRGQGYGNRILRLAVEKLAEMGVKRVLVTCDSDNEASRCVIQKTGGVLENHTQDEDGVAIDRYWIDSER